MSQAERIGRFEVLERVRGNSFALVYRGRDPFGERLVEIKVCVAADESIRRRFLMAAEQAATLRHANVATVYEFGSGEAKPYLVQEIFSDETLGDLMTRREPIDDVLKLYYLVQVARGLHYAHGRGVLHREIRPASVLVNSESHVKLADFGIARLSSAVAQLGNGAHRWPALGWIVPELLLGLDLDARSDVYGFGALAYELLTGSPPFSAETLASLVPQVLECEPQPVGEGWPECPPELDEMIRRCLARDPGRRFHSMDELIGELGSLVPVGQPSDIEEEERTLVTDVRTIYVPEPAKPSQPAPSPAPATSRPQLTEVLADLGGWARQKAMSGLEAGRQLAVKVPTPTLATARRWQAGAIVLLAALLFGVVGWSLARGPQSDSDPAAARPELPVAGGQEESNGLLIIDSVPWAEVKLITDATGRAIDLPDDPFTPLSMALPPGRYEAELVHPGASGSETCVTEVTASRAGRCAAQIAAIDVNHYFRETGWWQ